MNILLTGYTGNLGPEIARQLVGHRVFALVRDPERIPHVCGVQLVEGDLEHLPSGIARDVEVIVHGAALTAFRAPLEALRRVNVHGTHCLLQFARACGRLQRFIHLSTTCVFGDRTGLLPEAPVTERPHFGNAYEQSKWEAEQLVLTSALPVEIARLAIVAGTERDGSVRHLGALHHTFQWFYRGLIPMIPGTPDAGVDLISTEFAASMIAALLEKDVEPRRIVHVSAGKRAPRLADLINVLAGLCAQHHRGWATGAVARPDLVDGGTFELFESSARQSGDVLLQRICEDAQSFLPSLLHERRTETSLAREIPLPEWRQRVTRIFDWLLSTSWGRNPQTITPSHACT